MAHQFRFNFANTREAVDVAILLGLLALCMLAAFTGFAMWIIWLFEWLT